MRNYDAATYGERIAEVYDDLPGPTEEQTDAAVAFLADLAQRQPGRVLELGVGTGRIALPLADHGLEVCGIDASPRMVERLRAKPGGRELPVTIGDFADVAVDGTFAMAYAAFNTFFLLFTQDDQLRCFTNVAAHLEPGGLFVIEAFVPYQDMSDRGERVAVTGIDEERVRLTVSRFDAASQLITAQHVILTEHGVQLCPVRLRYAWPTELDLMARIAGMHLIDRHGGWGRQPFTAASADHISVYQKPTA